MTPNATPNATPQPDRDRTAVYAAEAAAFEGTDLEQIRPFDALASLVHAVIASEWWPSTVDVEVRRARSDAHSSSARTRQCDADITEASGAAQQGADSDRAIGRHMPTRRVQIRIAHTQATVATAAHELAHALRGVPNGHDAAFRAAYLDCVQMITNVPLDVVAELRLQPREMHSRRGFEHVRQLAEAFAAFEVPAGERQWSAPPWSGATAL